MEPFKVAGIGDDPKKGYLKKLKEKYNINNHNDILQNFETIEGKIWGVNRPEETRAFIDGLIKIIYDDIRYPLKEDDQRKNNNLLKIKQKQTQKRSNLKDSKKEIANANKLAKSVGILIQGKEGLNETIGKTMEKLQRKLGTPEIFDNFLCCLLMSELPQSTNGKQANKDEIKANLFTGVFKSWDWLQKLDQVDDTQLEQFFNDEKVKKYINRKNRTKKVTTGFQQMKFLIKANKLKIKEVDSYCKNEEAIQNTFYNLFVDSQCKIKRADFTHCYVSVKTHTLHFDNLKNHLEWEIQEVRESFHFLNLSSTSTTENGVNNLQNELVNLWNQVKSNVNDAEKWKITENHKVLTTPVTTISLGKLKCLQINLKHCEKAWDQLIHKWLEAKPVHVVFIQEPYITKISKDVSCYCFPRLPKNYRAVHNYYLIDRDQEFGNGDDEEKDTKSKSEHFISAILVHKDVPFERILPMTVATHDNYYNYPQELTVGIRLTGEGWNGFNLFSIYCRPIRSLVFILKPLRTLTNYDMSRTVLSMDANATHPKWSFTNKTDVFYSGRGEDLEEFRNSCKLEVGNGVDQTKQTSHHIDVTFYGDDLSLEEWKKLEDVETFSDHRYITFSITRKTNAEETKESAPLLSSMKTLSMQCLGKN